MQNTALSPHPCGLPRPSGNVSAILRPSAPAVSVAQVGKLMTGCSDRRPGQAQPPPGEMTGVVPESVPGGAPLFLMAGDVEDLRAGADREIAEGAEIAALIAHDLAVGAHLLQID